MSDHDESRRAASTVDTGAVQTPPRSRWLEEPEAFAAARTVEVHADELNEATEACFLVVDGHELARRYRIDQPSLSIGRAADADIRLAAEGASRLHARVERERGVTTLIDLDSTNGTYVNGHRISRHVLQRGDRVQLGDTTLRYLASPRLDAACYDEIYRLTTTDDATGIYNKRYFFQTLEREVARAIRHQRPLTLLMIGLSGIAEINATAGYIAGDSVLVQLAERIRTNCRIEDIFARLGSDEFCLLLPETDAAGAQYVATRLQRLLNGHPFAYDGEGIPITVHVGIASIDDNRPAAQNVRDWSRTASKQLDRLIETATQRLAEAQEAYASIASHYRR